MDDLLSGLVVAVSKRDLGTQLTADAVAGSMTLQVDDVSDFNPSGGQVVIGDGSTLGVDYAAADDDESTITLLAPLDVVALTGTVVAVYPPELEMTAMVLVDAESDPIPATVPYNWQDALPAGIREEEDRERVRLTRDGAWSFAIFDILSTPLLRRGPLSVPTGEGGTAGGVNEFGDVLARDLFVTGTANLSADATMIDGVSLRDYLASVVSPVAGRGVKVYAPTVTRWWREDTLTTPQPSDDQYVGYSTSPGAGNRRSVMWFDSAAIRADLAAARVTKVQLRLTIWSGGNDKTVVIGSHADPVVRDSWTAIAGKVQNRDRKADINEGSTVWIDLSDWSDLQGWVTGSVQGLLVGPGRDVTGKLSDDDRFRCSYRGAQHESHPALEITYQR